PHPCGTLRSNSFLPSGWIVSLPRLKSGIKRVQHAGSRSVDHAGSGGVPPPDDDRPISYVAAEIGPEHVLASSAIPIVFPPIHIGAPAAAAGWYLDGGIRLNAPLKPALALGADAIAVVATHPISDTVTPAPANQSPPDVDDVVVRLMD